MKSTKGSGKTRCHLCQKECFTLDKLGDHLAEHGGPEEVVEAADSKQSAHHIARLIPDKTPCGCALRVKSGQNIGGSFIVLNDGTRVCRHGKRWRLEWKEIGSFEALVKG